MIGLIVYYQYTVLYIEGNLLAPSAGRINFQPSPIFRDFYNLQPIKIIIIIITISMTFHSFTEYIFVDYTTDIIYSSLTLVFYLVINNHSCSCCKWDLVPNKYNVSVSSMAGKDFSLDQ